MYLSRMARLHQNSRTHIDMNTILNELIAYTDTGTLIQNNLGGIQPSISVGHCQYYPSIL